VEAAGDPLRAFASMNTQRISVKGDRIHFRHHSFEILFDNLATAPKQKLRAQRSLCGPNQT